MCYKSLIASFTLRLLTSDSIEIAPCKTLHPAQNNNILHINTSFLYVSYVRVMFVLGCWCSQCALSVHSLSKRKYVYTHRKHSRALSQEARQPLQSAVSLPHKYYAHICLAALPFPKYAAHGFFLARRRQTLCGWLVGGLVVQSACCCAGPAHKHGMHSSAMLVQKNSTPNSVIYLPRRARGFLLCVCVFRSWVHEAHAVYMLYAIYIFIKRAYLAVQFTRFCRCTHVVSAFSEQGIATLHFTHMCEIVFVFIVILVTTRTTHGSCPLVSV